jgi:protoporphyrinogen oxidase
VGGLCSTFEKFGCRVDYGVHLLHLRDNEVKDLVFEIVERNEILKIKRNGKLYVFNKFINWPLNITSIMQIPFKTLIRIAIDQLCIKISKINNVGISDNYKTVTESIYGKTLYENFFGPLTKKFFNYDPSNIHSDWAISSIRSATKIEDKDFQEHSEYLTPDIKETTGFGLIRTLVDNIVSLYRGEEFYYFKNGYGVLADNLHKKCIDLGMDILFQSKVKKINIVHNEITSVEVDEKECQKTYKLKKLMWTGSSENLAKLLSVNKAKFSRINSMFMYIYLNKKTCEWQTCYFADDSIPFVRATFLSNHSPYIISRNDVKSVLCVEFTFAGQIMPDINSDQIVKKLKALGVIKDKSEVIQVFQVIKRGTYPLFSTKYLDQLNEYYDQLDKFSNLYTFGRQGSFSYENADILLKNSSKLEIFDDIDN